MPHPAVRPAAVHLLAALTAIALLAVLLVSPLPATGQATDVHSPTPAPHAVVEAGRHPVGAVVEGSDGPVQVMLDGAVVEGPVTGDDLGRTLTEVSLTPGRHLLQLQVDGQPAREWPVLVSGVRTSTLAADGVSVGLAASGPPAPDRAVLLLNPATPALSLAAGPLASGTGAVLLPSGQAELPAATRDALQQLQPRRVMLLGGLDAIGPAVAAELADAGHEVERIGSGTPADVAAAAATRAAIVPVYRRDGIPQHRPVVLAPAEPPAAALQAAVDATRRRASLLLADGERLSPDTTQVLSDRTTVWLADGLSSGAAAAARGAAPQDATVEALPAPGENSPTNGSAELWVVDGSDPNAVLAARAAGPDTDVILGREAAAQVVARDRPERVTVVGDQPDAATVSAWWVDGTTAPQVSGTVTGGTPIAAPTVTLDVDRTPQTHAVHVSVLGREWPGTTTVEGSTISWRGGPRPLLPAGLEPATQIEVNLDVTAVVAADDAERHLPLTATTTIGPASSTSPEGFTVAGGTSAVVGEGPLRTFTIEIEPGTGLDLAAVTEEATAILLDPDRGWTARGQRSLQRVADPADAHIRVVVARPATVDAHCRRVGLDTGGRLSCWDGRRAMLNLTRWNTGVSPFHTDLTVYRQYLVSHEVGHGLGYGHVGCPAAGAAAPVMMQQSKGLGACVANGWPYPSG